MIPQIHAPRGTQDVLPGESEKLRFIEDTLLDTASKFGFREIRTPVFEQTDLFARGVGETTDVVQKEMYTFEDNGHRSVTLRPEGTAGAVRAFIEHGLFNEPLPQKLSYITSCYRYEKPQAGRLREFHQFGVECFGSASAAADAELISLASQCLDFFALDGIELHINSIGCPECRRDYQKALRDYYTAHIDVLCDTCKDRLERNPMRILDCKNPECHALAADAPKVLDYLCDDCREHFALLQKYLDSMEIAYSVDPMIVRGLDYYTRTVFEFVGTQSGSQGTVCGGGRYDGLVSELGGPATPACGFGMGLERLLLLLDSQQTELPEPAKCDVFLAMTDSGLLPTVMKFASDMRSDGTFTLFDTAGRSLKAQMKFADRIGAKYTVVLGQDELDAGKAKMKNMSSGGINEIGLSDISESVMRVMLQDDVSSIPGLDTEGI